MRHIHLGILAAIPIALALGGCKTQHKVEHEVKGNDKPVKAEIEVKPIHITVDVNVKVQVEKELANFFDFQEPVEPLAGTAAQGSGDPISGVKAVPINVE